MSVRSTRRPVHGLLLLVIWIACAAHAWHYLDRGWWPNNAGAFSLSAERVLRGELPHRDFDEIYTGGAAYLHALAFKVFGTTMAAPRRALFIVFLTWIPSFYYIASRFAPLRTAAIGTLLAAAWSIPIYSEPITSWYNLFLATHGAAAILRYIDSRESGENGRRRWLVVAGVCGGLSLLAKIIGIYFIAAIGLALLFDEQHARGGAHRAGFRPGSRSLAIAWSAFLVLGLAAGVALLAIVVQRQFGMVAVVYFAVPVAAVAAVLIRHEITAPRVDAASRIRALGSRLWPVALGIGIAVTPFLLPYVASGSLPTLGYGLFVAPRARLAVTATAPPWPPFITLSALLLLAWPLERSFLTGNGAHLLLAAAGLGLVWNGWRPPVYGIVIESIRVIVPVAVIAGCVVLLWRGVGSDRESSIPPAPHAVNPSMVFMLLATAACCSLVQFPVAEQIYIFFAAPLGLLALMAALGPARAGSARVLGILGFYVAFSVIWIDRSIHMGVPYPPFVPDRQTERLALDRSGGIRVRAVEKQQYETVVRTVRTLVPRGTYIYATPDCPEIYFLTGMRNPTRTSYDFFDDPIDRVDRIRQTLVRHDVRVVVLNDGPQYSLAPEPELLAHLRATYPESLSVGAFEVRWKR